MPSHSISDLLVATDELKALSARTRRLRELQTLYLGSAPRELVGSSRVKSFKAGVVSISADNGVTAAKLKQLAPTVLTAMRKADAQITGIRIDVQVSQGSHPPQKSQRKPALSTDSIQQISRLAETLPAGSLKLALANMVRRHQRNRSG